jgi:hypothetical protein
VEVICIKDPAPQAQAQNCANYSNGTCAACSKGFYLADKVCTQIPPICKSFDTQSRVCTECYLGYNVENGTCIKAALKDVNCKTFTQGVCTECSKGFYFDSNKVCTQIDPFCKNFDGAKLVCTACFNGFVLVSDKCQIDQNKTVRDPYCRNFSASGDCVQCSLGFYFDKNSVCTQVPASCMTFDYKALVCTACYPGYELSQSVCVKSNKTVAGIVNCA